MKGQPWQDETVQALKQGYQKMIDAQAAQIAQLREALESLQYYVGNPSAWEYYDDEMSERIRKACEVAEPQFWMAPENRDAARALKGGE